MSQEKILQLLTRAKKDCVEFSQKYQGGGIIKKLKRFYKYKLSYFNYILERLGFKKKYSLFKNEFDLIKFGFGEIKTLEFFIKHMKKGDVFYDIGANQGLFSLLIKDYFDNDVEIHSFEPCEDYFKILNERFKKYTNKKNIYLNQLALADYIGYLDLKIPIKIKFGFASSASVIDDFSKKYLKNYREVKVRCITLDEYCKSHKAPNFIKIDVDGAEQYVINGGISILSEFNPVISMEIVGGKLGIKYSLKAAIKLYKLGYKIFYISDESSNKLIEFSLKDLYDYIKYKDGDNFIFSKNNIM